MLTNSNDKTSEEIRDDSDSGLCHGGSISTLCSGIEPEATTDTETCQTVKINVGGTIFEVTTETLKSVSGTRLCRLAEALHDDKSYRKSCGDFYFDRNPAAFADILEYYRSGEMHMDQVNCGAIFKKELQFWQLDIMSVSMCCWTKFDSYKANSDIYLELDDLFRSPTSDKLPERARCWPRFRSHMFHTLEDPNYSIGAKIFVFISFMITFGSIFTFVAESHYLFQQIKLDNGTLIPAPNPAPAVENGISNCNCYFNSASEHLTNHTTHSALNDTHSETDLEHDDHDDHEDDHHIDAHIVLHYLDYLTFSYFMLEFVVRFIVSYRKKEFMRELLNVVEIVCLIAHFISLVEHGITKDGEVDIHEAKHVVYLLKSLRIMRVFRIFRLFRHMTGFKVLVYTIYVSLYELLLILSFLFAAVLIFASIIHYVEAITFTSIPYSIWWALVTMTTVGYGDVVPTTPLGYGIGAVCVISGALVVAFTVPVVVNNFTLYYTLSKSRKSKLEHVKQRKTLARDAIRQWNQKRKMGRTVAPLTILPPGLNKFNSDS